MLRVPMTVVETCGFVRDAEAALTGDERNEVIAFLGANPDAGAVMPETGGCRKLRWAVQGKGKRGGARVIYYFHNESLPLFLMNVFAKNAKDNLTRAERNELKGVLQAVVAAYRKGITS